MGKYDEGEFAVPPSLSLGDAMNFAHGVGVSEATEKLSKEIDQLRKEKEHLGNLLEQSWRAGAESIREVERLTKEYSKLCEEHADLKERFEEEAAYCEICGCVPSYCECDE